MQTPRGPMLSTVIVGWNTRALMRACLRTLEQACRLVPGECRTVVVDNASTDGTVEMLRAEFPWVATIANATNRGFAAATNQGIAANAGAGDYVLLLNPDTEVEPDAVAQMVAFLEAHPAAGAVGPRVIGTRGELQASCFPFPTLGREIWRLLHLDRCWPLAEYRIHRWGGPAPRRVDVLQGCCLMVRRTVLASIGALDERFFIYTEEVDLCRRMRDARWELYWLPGATIVHLGGQSTRQVARPMFLELYRSKVEYFRKHGGAAAATAYKGVLAGAAVSRIVASGVLLAVRPHRRRELQALIGNYSALLTALPAL